ncbi:alpha/beta fold hydrolase [Dactylosporangium sp. CA-092794]|uniref:alpha/beta fold hydrolase n=1 Tax=Dactylosporangium sp. CA-092794 TaxID=3239929 RepID=UPI003D8C645B
MTRTGVARANGIEICYETFGDPARPAMLLIMGLGVQLTAWEPEFCQAFADQGFYVIRYDNRDTGLSTRCEPGTSGTEDGAYTLYDMAADGIGLLATLGIARAHVVGASMGGMIAQAMAIRYPDQVLSLCSIMSTTGAPGVNAADPRALGAVTATEPETRDDAVRSAVARARLLAGGGFSFDEPRVRRRAAAAFDRANYPAGKQRHRAAIAATGDRTEALRQLRLPTVVIHGDSDPVMTPSCGKATAAAIPGAKLVVIAGMGHEIPLGAQPQIIEAVVRNARRTLTSSDLH